MNETLFIIVAALRKAARDQFASGYPDRMMLGDVLKSIADAIEDEMNGRHYCKPKSES